MLQGLRIELLNLQLGENLHTFWPKSPQILKLANFVLTLHVKIAKTTDLIKYVWLSVEKLFKEHKMYSLTWWHTQSGCHYMKQSLVFTAQTVFFKRFYMLQIDVSSLRAVYSNCPVLRVNYPTEMWHLLVVGNSSHSPLLWFSLRLISFAAGIKYFLENLANNKT